MRPAADEFGSYRRCRAGPAAENRVDLDRLGDADAGATGCETIGATTRSKPCVLSTGMRALARDRRFRRRRDRAGQHLACARAAIRGEDGETAWLGSLSKRGELNEILTSLAELYRRGYEVDWDGFNRPYPRRRVSLPTYPFEHRRFWIEADATERSTASLSNGLTGVRLRSALPDAQFESAYSLQRFAYLDDHRIYGMPVLPTTAGLTALRDAARQYFGSDAVEIANLQYREAMVLPESGERIVQSILTPLDDSAAEFRFASIG